jgi:outer membrane protein TolC
MSAQCIVMLALILQGPPTLEPAEPLTLPQAEQKALVANPALQAARMEAAAARSRATATFGRHLGELSLVGTYDRYELDRLVVPMAKELLADPALGLSQLPWDRNQVHYGLTWQIPLLASGTLYEGDRIAKLSRSVSEHLALHTRDEVLYNVRASYRNALLAGHALEAAQTYQAALEKDDADAQLNVSIGAMAEVDAAKIAFALRGAEAQTAELAAQRELAQGYLAALLGEERPAAGYGLSDLPDEPSAPSPSPTEDTRSALTGRGDLTAVREATRIVQHKQHLALEAFAPQLVLQGTYLRNDAPSLGAPLYTREWALLLKLPLFDGLSRVFSVREASSSLQAARQRERAKELEVATQVLDAEGRLGAARALYLAGGAQRRLGQEVARVEHLKLEQGTGKMEDYLTARSQELAGETAYWRGLYSYQSAVDYLAFVTARGGSHE